MNKEQIDIINHAMTNCYLWGVADDAVKDINWVRYAEMIAEDIDEAATKVKAVKHKCRCKYCGKR